MLTHEMAVWYCFKTQPGQVSKNASNLHRSIPVSPPLLHLLSLSQLLQLLRPDHVAEELPGEIQYGRQCDHDDEEDEAQNARQHVQDGIDPNAGHVFDHMQPDEVASHEDGQSSDAGLATRILTERREQFQEDEDDNVCVQDVV